MKMIFTGKVSGEKTVLAAGARHTVKAQAGEQYGLVDEVTGLVPDGVEADRSGDDLILRKKEDDTEIRIEGFWEECQPGETQCTAVFNVVGENGQVTEAVLTQDGPVLENFTAGQSGTLAEGINNGIIWGGIAFGAGLAAIALAAGGGGGSSRHKRAPEDEQKPVQPEGGQEAEKTEVSSTGSTEAGSGNSSGHVTDQDGNGKADAEEAAAAVAAATEKVEAAEAADKAAKDKLAELNADKLITPEEKAQLETAKQNADTLKGEADSAVKALPDTAAEKGGLQGRVDALDGIQVPEVNDQDGNGKADAEEAAETRAFYEKAFSNVYQTGDLYAKTDAASLFSPAAIKLAKSTSQWKAILENNAGSQMSQDKNAGGEIRYVYNGISGSDIITVGQSVGGTGLNMTHTRNDMKIITGDGDDVIIAGQDYGRLASSGQWDYKYLTEMGSGDDTLIVGASNSNLNVIMFSDGSIGAVKKDNSQLGDVIPFNEGYNTADGGHISGTTIDMGSGNDTVLALGHENGGTAIINATIKLGEGNDTIQINGDVMGGTSPSVITGDAGMDTLIISNGLISSEDFSGFENIELGINGEVKIVAGSLVKSDSNSIEGGILKITGGSDSKVDLDGNDWIKGDTESEGDITYNIYTHASVPDVQVLIDERITNVV
ncbi:GA-like domain-containing protein [Escherichia coli]